MIKYKNVIEHNLYTYELSEGKSVDFDTQFDFDIAEFLYKKMYC